MKKCEQMQGVSIHQHCISVKEHLFDLIDYLNDKPDLKFEWKLPDWLIHNKELILNSLPSRDVLELYTLYHDCGKPFCIVTDGVKKHFPEHSKKSYEIFKEIFNDPVTAYLILHDIDIHTLKSIDVKSFSKNQYALTLLLTRLAEIHTNAEMFGGFDSTSFKIKYKSISTRGRQIIKLTK